MVDAQLLALRIAYLVKESGKNRLTMSEAKLKTLARREVLPIPYLADLKQRLEELGYFLGTLEGGYCLIAIDSLKGSPSIPLDDRRLALLDAMPRNKLEEYCITPTIVTLIADNKQDEQLLLLNELWIELTKIATHKEVISYGNLATKLKGSFGYKVHHKKIIVLLEVIAQFCTEEKLPSLAYLAINAKSELPITLKNTVEDKNKFEIEKTKIYDFKWSEQKNNFDLFLNKTKEK